MSCDSYRRGGDGQQLYADEVRQEGLVLQNSLSRYLVIHAGFAISKLTKKQARETLAIFAAGKFFG